MTKGKSGLGLELNSKTGSFIQKGKENNKKETRPTGTLRGGQGLNWASKKSGVRKTGGCWGERVHKSVEIKSGATGGGQKTLIYGTRASRPFLGQPKRKGGGGTEKKNGT